MSRRWTTGAARVKAAIVIETETDIAIAIIATTVVMTGMTGGTIVGMIGTIAAMTGATITARDRLTTGRSPIGARVMNGVTGTGVRPSTTRITHAGARPIAFVLTTMRGTAR